MQSVDRPARQRFVGLEQPTQGFLVGVTAVVQNSQKAREPLHDLTVFVEEHLGDAQDTAALDCDDLAIAKQLVHLTQRQPEILRYICQLKQGNRRIQDIVTIRKGAHTRKFIGSGERTTYRPARGGNFASVALATMDTMRSIR